MNVLKAHVSLNVTNIDASVAFYEKVFDVAATKRRPGYAKFDLGSPSLNLTMQEGPRSGVNASHFGIQVETTDDVTIAATRFERAGLRTRLEDTSCCYSVQTKVWVEDPDGNMWEVFVVKGDSPTMCDPSDAPAATSTCCAAISLSGPPPSDKKTGCC